jgi:hypothetical protein
MDRRGFLAAAGAAAASLWLPRRARGQRGGIQPSFQASDSQYGWVPNPQATENFIKSNDKPFLRQQNSLIRASGEGKKALWYRMFEKVTGGPLVPHHQLIGDCVGQGFALGVDFLTCHQIDILKKREKWVAKASSEWIYGVSRCEVGGQFDRWTDGSVGVWAAEAVSQYGVILRQPYPGGFDLTEYDPDTAKTFGAKGGPDILEPIAKQHPVQTVALVNSWEECRDAIYNGHMVAMCSNLGFGDGQARRDSEGFLRKRGIWYHCMFLGAVDDEYRRPGALAINSWGPDWVTGPKRHDQPEGSFWIDAEWIDNAMKQGDSIAMSAYVGYPKVVVPDYIIW